MESAFVKSTFDESSFGESKLGELVFGESVFGKSGFGEWALGETAGHLYHFYKIRNREEKRYSIPYSVFWSYKDYNRLD